MEDATSTQAVKYHLSATMSKELAEEIESKRGIVCRSAFVEDRLRKGLVLKLGLDDIELLIPGRKVH